MASSLGARASTAQRNTSKIYGSTPFLNSWLYLFFRNGKVPQKQVSSIMMASRPLAPLPPHPQPQQNALQSNSGPRLRVTSPHNGILFLLPKRRRQNWSTITKRQRSFCIIRCVLVWISSATCKCVYQRDLDQMCACIGL